MKLERASRTTVPIQNNFEEIRDLRLHIQSFRYNGRIAYPNHTHSESSIVICTRGALESLQFGTITTLRPGEVLITNRHTLHFSRYCVSGEPTEGVTIDLDHGATERLAGLHRELGAMNVSTTRYLGAFPMPKVYAMAEELKREMALDRMGKGIVMECLALQSASKSCVRGRRERFGLTTAIRVRRYLGGSSSGLSSSCTTNL